MLKKARFLIILLGLLLMAVPASASGTKRWDDQVRLDVVSSRTKRKGIAVNNKLKIRVTRNGRDIPYSELRFSSSAPRVASVTRWGTVKAKNPGKAVIAIRYRYRHAALTVRVFRPGRSVSLDRHSLTMQKGTSKTLSAVVRPYSATYRNVKWTSSNPSVVSVNNGVLKAHKAGNAVITASAWRCRRSDSCTVKVNAPQKTPVKPQVPEEDPFSVTVHGVTFDTSEMREKLYIYGDTTARESLHNQLPDTAPSWSNTTKVYCGSGSLCVVPDKAIRFDDIKVVINDGRSAGIDNSAHYQFVLHAPTYRQMMYTVPDWNHACATLDWHYASSQYMTKIGMTIGPMWNTGDFNVAIYYKGSLVRKTHVYIMRPDANRPTDYRKKADYIEKEAWKSLPANASLYEKVKAARDFICENYSYDEIDCKDGAQLLAFICLDLKIPGLHYWFQDYQDALDYGASVGLYGGVPGGHTALRYTDPETGEEMLINVNGHY